jgi:hypothetical protein
MDMPTEKFASNTNQTKSFFSWVKTVIIKTRRLIGFFDLSDEDRIKAGIYTDDD